MALYGIHADQMPLEFLRGAPRVYSVRHQNASPKRTPVVKLDHLFLIMLMTQNLEISRHPLILTPEFASSARDDVVNLDAIGGATPHAPPPIEPQHEAAQQAPAERRVEVAIHT